MTKRGTAVAMMTIIACMGITVVATADSQLADDGVIDSAEEVHGQVHHQHGGTTGHLPATAENVRLVGKMNVNQDVEGRISDVGVLGNYAYLGAFNERDCQKGGVYVFDIGNPAAPKQINFIRTANNSYVGEGVQAIHLETPAFKGDVLTMNNEICGPAKTGAVGGLTLVDITNPKVHKYLARGVGDFDPVSANGPGIAHQIHSAFIWQAGDRAYVVIVDDEENADVDIMDITDPRNPLLITEYDVAARFPQVLQSGLNQVFFHDVVVKNINGRFVMLLSYWDAGYVLLDVTDPVNPTYIGDSDFKNPDPQLLEQTGDSRKPEGNGHEAEFSLDSNYIVAADEDFGPFAVVAKNVTDNEEFPAAQGSDTPKLAAGQVIEGQTKFVGRACPGDPAVPAGNGSQIAVIERGVCLFTEKVAAVEQAGGYTAALVFNRVGSDACNSTLSMSVAGNIPTFGVMPRQAGFDLFGVENQYDDAACLAAPAGSQLAPIPLGATGDTVRFESYFDGWGYVHLFANGAGKLQELDTWAIPEGFDASLASGHGDLTVHEVAMSQRSNTLAYFSYYAGGFRVARIVDDKLVETGRFIDTGGNNFWGVQVWQKDGKEYVLASDRDYGVYIFEYTGPGKVNP